MVAGSYRKDVNKQVSARLVTFVYQTQTPGYKDMSKYRMSAYTLPLLPNTATGLGWGEEKTESDGVRITDSVDA